MKQKVEEFTECTRYDFLDVLRLYAAVLVVIIHINQRDFVTNAFREAITRQAVPFFFICSGFFF